MKTTIKSILITFLLLTSTLIFAQNPGDPGQDPGVTPINDYIIPMIVLGIVIGFHLLRKRTTIVK